MKKSFKDLILLYFRGRRFTPDHLRAYQVRKPPCRPEVSTKTLCIPIEEPEAKPVPTPSSLKNIRRATETMITHDKAIAKYDISRQCFYLIMKEIYSTGVYIAIK